MPGNLVQTNTTEEYKPEIFHIMPAKGDHIASCICWCEPEMEYEHTQTGNQVWVHKQIQ